jgi:hypothetical protein
MNPESRQEQLYSYLIRQTSIQKLIKRDKEDHFILIKETIHQHIHSINI